MSPDTTPIVKSIRRTLRWLVATTVVLWLVVLGGGGYLVWKNHADEVKTRIALCTFRADLGKRITQTRDYLGKHPEPTILGVSRATFEKSLADEVRTYSTLSGLGC